MIGLSVTIKRDDRIGKRRFENACKSGFAALGTVWHDEMLPDHFESGNWRRYGHQPRTKKWRERKKRLAKAGKFIKGGEVDLVATGLMERTMEGFATVKPFPTRATVRVQAPRYMTVQPSKSNQPNKFAELSRVTAPQRQKLEKTVKKNVEAELKE